MPEATPFAQAVEAADKLTLEEQEMLLEIVHRRLIEQRRAELAKDMQEAQQEFQAGGCRPVTPEELMGEVLP